MSSLQPGLCIDGPLQGIHFEPSKGHPAHMKGVVPIIKATCSHGTVKWYAYKCNDDLTYSFQGEVDAATIKEAKVVEYQIEEVK